MNGFNVLSLVMSASFFTACGNPTSENSQSDLMAVSDYADLDKLFSVIIAQGKNLGQLNGAGSAVKLSKIKDASVFKYVSNAPVVLGGVEFTKLRSTMVGQISAMNALIEKSQTGKGSAQGAAAKQGSVSVKSREELLVLIKSMQYSMNIMNDRAALALLEKRVGPNPIAGCDSSAPNCDPDKDPSMNSFDEHVVNVVQQTTDNNCQKNGEDVSCMRAVQKDFADKILTDKPPKDDNEVDQRVNKCNDGATLFGTLLIPTAEGKCGGFQDASCKGQENFFKFMCRLSGDAMKDKLHNRWTTAK